MVGCAASKRARLTLAVGERSLSAWNAGVSAVKPRNLLPHDGAVPGLLLFRRRRVVRGLVRGCHGVDWHYVDEACDFCDRRLVAGDLVPVEGVA